MALELDHIRKMVRLHLTQRDYEEAFCCLWKILENHQWVSQLKTLPDQSPPLYEQQDCTIYEEVDLVLGLPDNNCFQGRPLFDILQDNPLELLWILDFYLYSRVPGSAKPCQKIKNTLSDDPEDHVWIVPQHPSRAFRRTTFQQWTDNRKFHPCHTVFESRIQGIKVTVEPLHQHTNRAFNKLESLDQLKIHVADFRDQARPEWINGVAHRLTHVDERKNEVKRHLEKAARNRCHLVVFPELTVDECVRNSIVEWLRSNSTKPGRRPDPLQPGHNIVWVVAGSFHEQMTTDTRIWINRSHSYGHFGQEIHKHTKISRFSGLGMVEQIKEWSDIWVLHSALGLASTPICLDYCQSNPGAGIAGVLLDRLAIDMCFVPAMDGSNSAYRRKAEHLHRFHGTVSAVAMQYPEDTPVRRKSLSFVFPEAKLLS